MKKMSIDNFNEVSGGAGFWENLKRKSEGNSLLKQYSANAARAQGVVDQTVSAINSPYYNDEEKEYLKNTVLPAQQAELEHYQNGVTAIKRDYGI